MQNARRTPANLNTLSMCIRLPWTRCNQLELNTSTTYYTAEFTTFLGVISQIVPRLAQGGLQSTRCLDSGAAARSTSYESVNMSLWRR